MCSQADATNPDRKAFSQALTPTDSSDFRHVLSHYPTGVCVVTAMDVQGKPSGMTVASFTSASLAPPLVAFFPGRGSSSWQRIREAGKFCVNVLGSHQEEVCKRFSLPDDEKYSGLQYGLSIHGSPKLSDIVAWMDCSLEAVHQAGDHDIAIGRVLAFGTVKVNDPLVYFRSQYGSFAPSGGG